MHHARRWHPRQHAAASLHPTIHNGFPHEACDSACALRNLGTLLCHQTLAAGGETNIFLFDAVARHLLNALHDKKNADQQHG